jgi:hypothetical protein
MANVLVNSSQVNRYPRNKRFYGGMYVEGSSQSNQQLPPQKAVIEFNTDTPTIPDYSIYADVYGQYPTIEMFTYDVDNVNNRIKRPELPYFNMILGDDGVTYVIDSIIFGTFGEGAQVGFITIGI